MLKTYLIIKRGYAEKREYSFGMLGTVMDHSKQRALNKALKLYKIEKEKLIAYWQPE